MPYGAMVHLPTCTWCGSPGGSVEYPYCAGRSVLVHHACLIEIWRENRMYRAFMGLDEPNEEE